MKYRLLKSKIDGSRSVLCDDGLRVRESENPALYADLRRKAIANNNRRARHDVLVSCGLTRVRGAMGGVYYE